MVQMVNAAIGAVTLDDSMSAGQIIEVGDQFRNFNVEGLEKHQLPTYGAGDDTFSYQEVDWDEAEPMLDVFRGLESGTELKTNSVLVSVDRSAAEMGDANVVEAALESQGFDAVLTSRAEDRPARNSSTEETVISYGPRGADAAALLGRYLDGPFEFDYDDDLPGAWLSIDPGTDLIGVRDEPLPAEAVWAPQVPTTTTTSTTTTSSPPTTEDTTDPDATTTTSTSTTVPGFVPDLSGSAC